MKHQFKFQKILDLREREKEEAFAQYEESVKKFEYVAEQLYGLLKKKEELESFQASQLAKGFSIREIRHYQQFIGNLNKTIEHYQRLVITARNRMNWCGEKLKDSNIEMKKYEKMKEKSHLHFMELEKQVENSQLDEMTSVQYFHREGMR
ncbi:MAG TPA: flagellar export protein FliJ [Bacillaceae bacterium]